MASKYTDEHPAHVSHLSLVGLGFGVYFGGLGYLDP